MALKDDQENVPRTGMFNWGDAIDIRYHTPKQIGTGGRPSNRSHRLAQSADSWSVRIIEMYFCAKQAQFAILLNQYIVILEITVKLKMPSLIEFNSLAYKFTQSI